jgi:hypothetical protein
MEIEAAPERADGVLTMTPGHAGIRLGSNLLAADDGDGCGCIRYCLCMTACRHDDLLENGRLFFFLCILAGLRQNCID